MLCANKSFEVGWRSAGDWGDSSGGAGGTATSTTKCPQPILRVRKRLSRRERGGRERAREREKEREREGEREGREGREGKETPTIKNEIKQRTSHLGGMP